MFYSDLANQTDRYEIMIEQASQIEAGCKGVTVIPELFQGGFVNCKGSISGLQNESTRAHVYRATLEALSFYTRQGLKKLEKAGNFKAQSVICVGGGSKNRLWNQIRADVLGVPIKVSDRKETTVLGAALFAMPVAGLYATPQEASENVLCHNTIYEPSSDAEAYEQIYKNYHPIFNQ
jgi:L-fuculokinase